MKEKDETPEMEAKSHSRGFLKKSLKDKGGKSKAANLKKMSK